MPGHQDHGLCLVYGPPTHFYQRYVSNRAGVIEPDNLSQVSRFHANVVQHAGMQRFGLIIQVASFLSRVSRIEKVRDLFVDVFYSYFEVSQGLWLQAQDCPYVWCFDLNERTQVDLLVRAVFLDQVLQNMPTMGSVGGTSHQASQEYYPALLSRQVNATGPPLTPCEVALAVGAEATYVAERRIPGRIGLHEPHVPASEVGGFWHRRGPYWLPGNLRSYQFMNLL